MARFRLPARRTTPHLPDEVRAAVTGGAGERVLAGARDTDTGAWLVAATSTVALVDPSAVAESGALAVAWRRPWHEVDQGSWDRDDSRLTITWTDTELVPGRWRLGEEALFLQVLRERVQASVVLTHDLRLPGRRTGRAVIRQDLATGDLVEQVVLGQGVRPGPEVDAAATVALAWLREQVGLAG